MWCLVPLVIYTNSTRCQPIPEVKLLRVRPGVRPVSIRGAWDFSLLEFWTNRTQEIRNKKCERGEGGEDSFSRFWWFSREREKFFIFHFRKGGGNFETKSALLSSGLWKGNKKHQSFYPSSPQPRSAKYKKCRLRDANFWATIFVSVDFTSAKVDSIRSLNFSSGCRNL